METRESIKLDTHAQRAPSSHGAGNRSSRNIEIVASLHGTVNWAGSGTDTLLACPNARITLSDDSADVGQSEMMPMRASNTDDSSTRSSGEPAILAARVEPVLLVISRAGVCGRLQLPASGSRRIRAYWVPPAPPQPMSVAFTVPAVQGAETTGAG